MRMIENNVIVMYRYENYLVEICKERSEYVAYLQKENFAVKMGMFGVFADISLESFAVMVEANIEDYVKNYEEEYGK